MNTTSSNTTHKRRRRYRIRASAYNWEFRLLNLAFLYGPDPGPESVLNVYRKYDKIQPIGSTIYIDPEIIVRNATSRATLAYIILSFLLEDNMF